MISHTCLLLVHGTFRTDPPWMRPGSALREYLTARAGEHVSFESFQWSGRNSSKARSHAGVDCRAYLGNLMRRNPDTQIVIVGHSHGGNVALHALRDRGVQSRVGGLITISTPFLTCRERESGDHIENLSTLVPLIMLAAALLFGFPLVGAMAGFLPDPWSIAVPTTLLIVGLLGLWLFGRLAITRVSKRVRRELMRERDEAMRLANLEVQSPPIDIPMLSLSTSRDEARLALGGIVAGSEMPFRIPRVVFQLWMLPLALGGLCWVGERIPIEALRSALSKAATQFSELTLGLASLSGVLYGLLVLATRARGLGLGLMRPERHEFYHVEVSSRLAGAPRQTCFTINTSHASSTDTGGWRWRDQHGALLENEEAFELMWRWLEQLRRGGATANWGGSSPSL